MTVTVTSPLLEAARRFCESRQIEMLDLLEELTEHLDEIMPAGCRISQCGHCSRRSAVPSGSHLREFREQHGFYQSSVAKEAGCTKQHISYVEADKQDPSPAIVRAYETLAARALAEQEKAS